MLTALTNHVSNGQLFKLHSIMVKRAGDVFIDEVYIGNGQSTTDLGLKIIIQLPYFSQCVFIARIKV